MIKLICPECRRENEAERIYCHDCGARLDRAALAKVPPIEEPPQDAHKRLKTLFDPQRAKLRATFFTLCKVILGALVAAALVEMFLPPVLPAVKQSASLPRQVSMELEDAAMNHGWAPIQYTENEVNTYIEYAAKNRKASLNKYLHFERVILQFKEGRLRVTVQRSLLGYVFSTAAEYRVALQNEKLIAICSAGQIGRLPIHPKAMQFGSFLFGDLLNAFDRERKSLAKMNAIQFHPQLVAITPRP